MSEIKYGPEDFVDVDERDQRGGWTDPEVKIGDHVKLHSHGGAEMFFEVVGESKIGGVRRFRGRPTTTPLAGDALFELRHVEGVVPLP